NSPNGDVSSIAIQTDGRILVAGNFDEIAGGNKRGMARLHADGSLDNSFDLGAGPKLGSSPGLDLGWIRLITLQNDGQVMVAGAFNRINGVNRNYTARLNQDG